MGEMSQDDRSFGVFADRGNGAVPSQKVTPFSEFAFTRIIDSNAKVIFCSHMDRS